LRLVMSLPSTTHSWSTQSAPGNLLRPAHAARPSRKKGWTAKLQKRTIRTAGKDGENE
jgi:hypothetical protein